MKNLRAMTFNSASLRVTLAITADLYDVNELSRHNKKVRANWLDKLCKVVGLGHLHVSSVAVDGILEFFVFAAALLAILLKWLQVKRCLQTLQGC